MKWFKRVQQGAEGGLNDRMDLYGGQPLWLVRNGLEKGYDTLDRSVNVDVAVVGGGINGALVTYHLIKAGVDCMVLDARRMGTGSTCSSTALLQFEIDTPLRELCDLVGPTNAVKAYKASVASVHALTLLAAEVGSEAPALRPSIQYASLARDVRGLKEECTLRQRNGIASELLTGDELKRLCPIAAPAALRSTPAATTDAWVLTHALHRASQKLGARIHERTAVVDVHERPDGLELHTSPGPVVKAKHVIYATGYESLDLLPANTIQLVSTYAISTTPLSGTPWPENALIWETATPYLYMRTDQEGRIIAGGRDERFRSTALRDALLGKKTAALLGDLRDHLPHLRIEKEFSWCGTFGMTKDGLPYIDQAPGKSRTWFALGMGGNGITFSLIAAEILRDRILGKRHPDQHLYRFER